MLPHLVAFKILWGDMSREARVSESWFPLFSSCESGFTCRHNMSLISVLYSLMCLCSFAFKLHDLRECTLCDWESSGYRCALKQRYFIWQHILAHANISFGFLGDFGPRASILCLCPWIFPVFCSNKSLIPSSILFPSLLHHAGCRPS